MQTKLEQARGTSKAGWILIRNSEIWQQFKDLTSVDAVTVVRCKYCKHASRIKKTQCIYCDRYEKVKSKNGYCDLAERREDDGLD